MFNIRLEKRVLKAIAGYPIKHQRQIKNKIISLKDNAKPNDSKLLKGFKIYYRVDIGEYRVIYKIEEDTIYIVLVGQRNDDQVYKEFKRLN
jgi:mRNA interferase RelE/StbE